MDRLTIFFDLDDTLYDRIVPYAQAFYQFFAIATSLFATWIS